MVKAREEVRADLLPAAKEAGAEFLMLASRVMSREDVVRWFRAVADEIESGAHDDKPSVRRTH